MLNNSNIFIMNIEGSAMDEFIHFIILQHGVELIKWKTKHITLSEQLQKLIEYSYIVSLLTWFIRYIYYWNWQFQ